MEYGKIDLSFSIQTDGKISPNPHDFEGIDPVDRGFFNGTLEAAKKFWDEYFLKQ